MSKTGSNQHGRTPVDTFVALLRGVNVGGKNMISMAALKASFERMGLENATSYINSGNIIFRARRASARNLEERIERMLSAEHRCASRVVVRSLSEMAALVRSIPETWNGDTRWRYNVIFLHHSVDSPAILDALTPRGAFEQVAYRPGTLLWSAQVKYLTRTAMLKLSAHKDYANMTVRSLNTTMKVYELMSAMAGRHSATGAFQGQSRKIGVPGRKPEISKSVCDKS